MDPSVSSLWLTGSQVAVSSSASIRADVEILDGQIRSVAQAGTSRNQVPPGAPQVNLDGYLILPGLINSHDHLEFNLFPRLGRGPYLNSRMWARDVYRPHRSPVSDHLAVPKTIRLWWGGLKNLLSGVTTVCHHNPYDRLFDTGFPVHVVRRYGWAHSLDFGADVHGKFLSTDPDAPFLIHLGEGTDPGSRDEIFALDRMGALDHRTVLVHAVALASDGHALRRLRGAAVVWCPTSNQFTLGTTLDAAWISPSERIALGSDSPLTAQGTLLSEIQFAHQRGLPPDLIYSMVTESAADILHLGRGEGRVHPGSIANLIAVPWTDDTPAEAIAGIDISEIEMVMLSGSPQLVSREVQTRWPGSRLDGLEWISLGEIRRKVRAPVRSLVAETLHYLRDGIQLAGMEVSA